MSLPQHCDVCRTSTLTVAIEERQYLHVTLDRRERALHVWLASVGLHLFWPDIFKSRPDWSPDWREQAV